MITLQNPPWLRCFLYAAVVGFPVLAASLAYFALDEAMSPSRDWIAVAIFLIMCGASAHICYFCFLLAPYISTTAQADQSGLRVTRSGRCTTIPWDDVLEVTFYDYAQILVLVGHGGRKLFVVDYWTPGYSEFVDLLDSASLLGQNDG